MNEMQIMKLYREAFDLAYEEMKECDPGRYYSDKCPHLESIQMKFAELIIKECVHQIVRCTNRDGMTEHNMALYAAIDEIDKKFGVK